MNKLLKIYKDSFRGLNKDVYTFALMMLINRIGTLILPFLTLYTTKELGWTKIDAGTATMWFGIGSLCGALLGGYLTDKIGYYKTMAISLFSAAILFYLLQFLDEFYVVCTFLFLSSLFADLLRPALMSGITLFTNKDTQTRAVSLLRMAFNLGIAIGPAVAGVLIESYGYDLIFTIDALTCLSAGFFLLKFVKNRDVEKKEGISADESSQSPYRDVRFMVFMFFSFLMLVTFFQILFTVPLFMTEQLRYSEKEVGIFYAVNGMLIFLTEMPLVHHMEQTMDSFKAMMIGALMIGLATLVFVFPLAPLFLMAVYTILVTYGEIINFPFISSTSMNRASKDNIGSYMSVNTVMFSTSLIAAPIIGMWLLDEFGYNILFIVMFIFCLASILGLNIIKRGFETA